MINQLLETLNLSISFGIAVFIGALLSVFLAQQLWQQGLEHGDSHLLANLKRAGLLLQALSFIWALDYGFNRQWQPWPPFLLIIVVLDLNMALRIVTVYVRAHSGSQTSRAKLVVDT